MIDGGVPAGWYRDPAGAAATERWWDGDAWSSRTRPVEVDEPAARSPVAAAGTATPEPGEGPVEPGVARVGGAGGAGAEPSTAVELPTPRADARIDEPDRPADRGRARWLPAAAGLLTVGVLSAVATWAVLDRRGDELLDAAAAAPVDAADGASDPGSDPATGDHDEDADVGEDDPTPDGGPAGDGPDADPAADDTAGADGSLEDPRTADVGDGTPELADAPGPEGEDAGGTVVELDGECEVVLTAEELERSDELRPWFHPGCAAPVVLDPGERRWIVVLESLAGADFEQTDAWERARGYAAADVLWSSHYPSLNPDLWVVFQGTYATEQEAAAAAASAGGGAYPRELSDDEGDRYCLAADGCRGERRN